MRYIIKTTALVLLPLVFSSGHVRADDPKVVTLSCDGALTATYGANKPKNMEESQKISVVVNLDDQTVFFWAASFPSTMSIRPASTSAEGKWSITVSASEAILIGQAVAWK